MKKTCSCFLKVQARKRSCFLKPFMQRILQTLAWEGSEALPGTLLEGEIIAGGIYIAMPTPEVMRE
jgi:hypothetical protein